MFTPRGRPGKRFCAEWTVDADHSGAGQPVAVISYGFWQRRFAADPAVLGKVVELDDVPVTIVEVMPAGFVGPWEQIFYGEFDGQRRKRVLLKILGE
jgi:hypothetical protein